MILMSYMLNNFKDIANNQHVYNRKTTTPTLHTSDTFSHSVPSKTHTHCYSLTVTAELHSSKCCFWTTHNKQEECYQKMQTLGDPPLNQFTRVSGIQLLKQHFAGILSHSSLLKSENQDHFWKPRVLLFLILIPWNRSIPQSRQEHKKRQTSASLSPASPINV